MEIVYSNQKWNNETIDVSVNIIINVKKVIVGIKANVFVKLVSI